MVAVGSDGLHGNDRHVPPAHLLQPLDHATQHPTAAHRQHDGTRLGTQCLLEFLDDGSVAFPAWGGGGEWSG